MWAKITPIADRQLTSGPRPSGLSHQYVPAKADRRTVRLVQDRWWLPQDEDRGRDLIEWGILWGAKKPASPLALTDRGRIAPASRRSAGGAGVSTSAMGHCGDIQAKDPIDCGEPLFAAAIAGAAAPISAAAA